MNVSPQSSTLMQAENVVAREHLLLLEEAALASLRDVPGLSFAPMCADVSSVYVVAYDGRPIGRVYRVIVQPIGFAGWVGMPRRPARCNGIPYATPADAARAVRARALIDAPAAEAHL
ncbi:hypothetical protein ACFOYW_05965 [Gryllotalpicola reticulitermitis]|uniref:YjbR protein n=1 Tax=Gryllotalpicola reticulitermitis TaxID=1184153 RepID=A0ABV8Q3H1_9MICO